MELSATRCRIKEKTIQLKNIYRKNNEELIITCLKEESVDSAISILKSSDLQNTCEVQKEQILNPKVRVTGINNIEQLDNNALAEDINMRNFINFDKKCRI